MAEMPAWYNRPTNVKKKSQKQEKSFSKRWGSRAQVASGATAKAKGDNKLERDMLIDNKFTKHEYYKVTSEVWEKLIEDCLVEGCHMMALQIELADSLSLMVLDINDALTMAQTYFGEEGAESWVADGVKAPPKPVMAKTVTVSIELWRSVARDDCYGEMPSFIFDLPTVFGPRKLLVLEERHAQFLYTFWKDNMWKG